MSRFDRWIARVSRRERRRPALDQALLTNRSWRYASYRLRYLVLRVLLRAGLHLAEMVLFASVFSMEFLGPIIVVRSATAVAVSLWWGGLEQLRTRVREEAGERQWAAVRRTIDAWLGWSLIVAGLVVGVGTALVLTITDQPYGFSIFNAYAIACFLRLGLDIFARTYHSGVFALRRIYRPLWSLLIGDLLDVVGVLALWLFLGPWSFSIVLAAVGIVRVVLLMAYVRRGYEGSRIPRFRARGLPRSLGALSWRDIFGWLRHALANGASQIDSLLIMTLVAASTSSGTYLGLAILFYMIRPFISASYNWGRLFYFDFKRLELRYSDFFKRRFEAFLRRVALVFGGGTAIVAAIWAQLFWGDLGWLAALFLPFFVSRSLFGLYQVQAFSYGRYLYLLKLTAALGLGILVLGLVPQSPLIVLASITVLMLGAVLIGGPPLSVATPEPALADGPTLPLTRWIDRLSRVDQPTRVCAAQVDGRLKPTSLVLFALAQRIGAGALTRIGRRRLVWFECDQETLLTRRAILEATGGCLRELQVEPLHDNGQGALDSAVEAGLLGDQLSAGDGTAAPALDAEGLRREFSRRFPEGHLLDFTGGAVTLARHEIDQLMVRQILMAISHTTRRTGWRRLPAGALDISVFCPRGELELLFVVDRREDPSHRGEWRKLVDRSTLISSLGPGSA